jgi:hypothetical protein
MIGGVGIQLAGVSIRCGNVKNGQFLRFTLDFIGGILER